MYFDPRKVVNEEEAVSFIIEHTRNSAEIEAFENRRQEFLKRIDRSDEQCLHVANVIRSIEKEHVRIGKRDFNDTPHYKRYCRTNNNKCVNVRDDQICRLPNGETYDGQYISVASNSLDESHTTSSTLLKHGKGKYIYANGDQYEGDWSYDIW